MRRVWAISGMLTAAMTALLAGCSPAEGVIEAGNVAVETSDGSLPPAEPARFSAPKNLTFKRIEEATVAESGSIQATSNEEQERSVPPSVLKRKAPSSEAANSPLPLPLGNSRNEGDFEAVAARARQLIEQAYGLADRGAIYTARSDLLTAMQVLCEAMDASEGGRKCTEALNQALTAMEEATDFVVSGETRVDLKMVISGHNTPVLKKANLQDLTSITAMQRYYTYAQRKLIEAGNGSRAASEALCGLGKVARHLPTSNPGARRNTLVKALVFQQSAIAVWEQNFHARNELGVLYAQLNRPEDAKEILREVAQTTNWPTAWTNLAHVHVQLKENELAELALVEARQAQKSNGNMAPQSLGPHEFKWVSPEQFIAEGGDAGPRDVANRAQAAPRR